MKLAACKKAIEQTPPLVVQALDKRLQEFAKVRHAGNARWFSELCFCLLTSNAKSSTACSIQDALGYKGFMTLSEVGLAQTIREHKHRFHNTKAKRIVQARVHNKLYDTLKPIADKDIYAARQWLVENVVGIGYKEASHFLRNVGYDNIAILDRHVMNLMCEFGWIPEVVVLNKKRYLDIESIFLLACKKVGMSAARLDYYFWYWKAGAVLK